jgi:hypothetical protein
MHVKKHHEEFCNKMYNFQVTDFDGVKQLQIYNSTANSVPSIPFSSLLLISWHDSHKANYRGSTELWEKYTRNKQ